MDFLLVANNFKILNWGAQVCSTQCQLTMYLFYPFRILVPLYDPDTHMCFLSGKGDRNLQFIELSDKEPFFVEGLKYSGEQTKGACLVPKRAMDVMNAEVNRVLQLCGSSIVPITWQVPRKVSRQMVHFVFLFYMYRVSRIQI